LRGRTLLHIYEHGQESDKFACTQPSLIALKSEITDTSMIVNEYPAHRWSWWYGSCQSCISIVEVQGVSTDQ
jgi:hypothetical protein